MALRVAGNTDGEMVAVLGLDVLDQVLGVLEPALDGGPVLGVPGRVASQRQDVLAPGVVRVLQGVVDHRHGHVSAGQMHARLQPENGLRGGHQVRGQVRQAPAAGVPGDVDELRQRSFVHAVHPIVEVLHTLRGLGHEVLERVRWLAGALSVLFQFFCDFHVEWWWWW